MKGRHGHQHDRSSEPQPARCTDSRLMVGESAANLRSMLIMHAEKPAGPPWFMRAT